MFLTRESIDRSFPNVVIGNLRSPIKTRRALLREHFSRRTGRSAAKVFGDDKEHEAISGASVLFLGIIRNHSGGRKVKYLEYEAYESMAEKMLEKLILEAHNRWPLEAVKLRHRLGCVHLGEIAVAIEVRAEHRDEAYQASRFLIEEIKHQVPIWKKEYFEDGTSQWSLCRHEVLSGSC